MNASIYPEAVRRVRPLIHSITNYVTATDCANLLLGCGARPMMADDPAEVAEITAASDGLLLNLGTPSERSVRSLKLALEAATRKGIPTVFDPVGVGASAFRRRAAAELLAIGTPSVIRGNRTEIRTLAGMIGANVSTSQNSCTAAAGVDAAATDCMSEAEVGFVCKEARALARACGAVIVVTGEIDVVTDGTRTACVRNGRPEMATVTGTGCQLTSLIAGFVASSPKEVYEATVAAVAAMGVAGEIAAERMTPADGNATYGRYLLDAVNRLTGAELAARARIEEIEGTGDET
ncbi:MAG: hydroxyethylthiazole kinase [Lachnospiraceae bacterium]|nr:hydroxyethylthiazole kinase [Lachnospiraceae bacterium]